MNPYYHAQLSARRFGGRWEDHHPIHAWLDATKLATASFMHRAFRHHTTGIADLVRIQGSTLEGPTGPIERSAIAAQHIAEDCAGRVPRLADWLEGARDDIPLHAHPDPAMAAARLASRFGGDGTDYRPLMDWLFAPWLETQHTAALLMRLCSAGIMTAEDVFGPALSRPGQKPVATRLVCEHAARLFLAAVPTAQAFLSLLPRHRWADQSQRWTDH